MKTFIKVLASVSLSLYAIISFIRLDLDVRSWATEGRAMFLIGCLFISAIVGAVIDSENINRR